MMKARTIVFLTVLAFNFLSVWGKSKIAQRCTTPYYGTFKPKAGGFICANGNSNNQNCKSGLHITSRGIGTWSFDTDRYDGPALDIRGGCDWPQRGESLVMTADYPTPKSAKWIIHADGTIESFCKAGLYIKALKNGELMLTTLNENRTNADDFSRFEIE